MNTIETICGTIERFVYQDDASGFSIMSLSISPEQTVTAKGALAHLTPGMYVALTGSWIIHPKFGKQFEVTHYQTKLPVTSHGLVRYLGSGLIKGIGPKYAQKLVDRFATDVLDVISNTPGRLHEVAGIGPKRVEKIINAWQEHKEISTVMVFLQDKHVSPAYALKIYKRYGQNAIALVTENPYRLAEEVWGIGFTIADQIAQSLGIERHSLNRIKAGITFAIKQAVDQGNLYIEIEALKKKSSILLQLEGPETEDQIKTGLRHLYEEQKIAVVHFEQNYFVTLRQNYLVERNVAQKMKLLLEHPCQCTIDYAYIAQELSSGFFTKDKELTSEQQSAVLGCLAQKVTIITGGPGTGKTTIIKTLLAILDHLSLSYLLAAPTGRAAKRITESTGKNAQTIHRLLEFDPATYQFSKNESNAFQTHFLIVDESSMIDIFLAHSLLKAVPYYCHLVFIGDIDQLPSVGAGNFLRDVIASNQFACIRLKTIFRQAQQSLIVVNAHRINQGELPLLYTENGERDFIFIHENDPTQVPNHLHALFGTHLKRFGISTQNTIVLSPMNKGVVGTQQLNATLQQIINPAPHGPSLSHSDVTFRCNDRVMQLRNNYDKLVFNGDMGTIEEIDSEESLLTVRFGPQLVTYQSSEIDELALAYAITIHKSQGSEFSAVIIPLFTQHYALLQRNLIYTALTRAKKVCIFIGQMKAVAMAIANNKNTSRKTFLQQYLVSDLQCR